MRRRLEIPSISAHTFLRIEDEVINKLSWQDEEYEKLVMLLFDSIPWRDKDKENLRLNIALSLLRGGRSSVIVLKLAFIHRKQPYGFIIRIHSTLKEAEKEKNNVDKLNINSPDCFANCMGQKELAGQYLVIYQDVGVNMVTQSIDELSESLFQRLSSQNEFTVFAHNFQKLIKDVTYSFEKVEDFKTISHDEYYDDILSQLPPELVINQAHLYQFDDLILKSQASILDEIEQIIDIHQFIHLLSEKNTSTQCFKLNEIWFDKNQGILTGDSKEIAYLPFTIEENSKTVYLWIAINKNELKDIESKLETTLDATSPCQLIFLADDVTFTAQLKKMGFDTQSCLSTLDFQALCDKYYAQLHIDMRHNDLHCGNVLTSENSFKVIDVGDMRADLIASDIARLEVSLWFEISKRLSEFSKQEAETVVENLMTDNVSNTDSDSLSISTRFSDFLRHLKKEFKAGVQYLPDENEIRLAYVIQILLYQRYSLLDGVDKIPVAFNVFARHWISQFRYDVDFTELPFVENREVVPQLESLVDKKLVTWDIIRQAYNVSLPAEEWYGSPTFSKNEAQNCLEAIYSIAVLPQNKENPPLAKFSSYIAKALSDSTEQVLLNNLISKYFSLSCPSKDYEPTSSCHFLVVVSTGTLDSKSYSVMIYLDKRKLLETEFIEEKKFRTVLRDKLKEAYSELMSYLLSTNGLCEEQVWIHFLLPTPLLSEAVDQYEIGDEWEKLGEEFKVVVNSWDRMRNKKALLRTKTCWKKYQDKMTRKIQCTYSLDSKDWSETNIPAIIINKEATTPHQILVEAKNSKPALAILEFSPKSTSIEKKDHLNALLTAGVPTILWMRSVGSKDEPVDNVIKNLVCDKQPSFNELPKYIHEKRNAALKMGKSPHIGNHLVLLWDDPELRLDEHPFKGAE
jgi:hypothetical protein